MMFELMRQMRTFADVGALWYYVALFTSVYALIRLIVAEIKGRSEK